MKIAVTGAFSYSGKYITRRLLTRGDHVITLTGHPDRPDPFEGRVPILPLDFGRPDQLESSLRGSQVLVNTYWIRFDRRGNTQAQAVENTRRLIAAAARAGLERIVHISITNPALTSPLPYFRGKAENERAVMGSNMTYAILRPTVLFGKEDILINNIAFFLRRFPFFLLPGDGSYELQPVYVDDLAALIEEAVHSLDNRVVDAVGPESFSFRELVELIARALGRRRPILSAPPGLMRLAAHVLGMILGDVVLTPHEISGLMANLLVSKAPPRGTTSLKNWLAENQATLGMKYASELARHYV